MLIRKDYLENKFIRLKSQLKYLKKNNKNNKFDKRILHLKKEINDIINNLQK